MITTQNWSKLKLLLIGVELSIAYLMSKYSFILVLYYIWLYSFSFEKKHLEDAQITFMHCLLHRPFLLLRYQLFQPALLYYFCLMNTATVCTYVYQVILGVSLIILWECSVVDIVQFLNIIFCLQKTFPAVTSWRLHEKKRALCDQSLTTFTEFSLKGSAILIPTEKKVLKRSRKLKCRLNVDDT